MTDEFNPADEPVVFDMGVSTLMRINYWLWKCNEASASDNVNDWFKAVKTIYKEADAFMSDSKKEGEKSEREAAAERLDEITGVYRNYLKWERGRKQVSSLAYGDPPREIFDMLMEWEMDLRRFLEKKGLLMRKGEDAKQAMLR